MRHFGGSANRSFGAAFAFRLRTGSTYRKRAWIQYVGIARISFACGWHRPTRKTTGSRRQCEAIPFSSHNTLVPVVAGLVLRSGGKCREAFQSARRGNKALSISSWHGSFAQPISMRGLSPWRIRTTDEAIFQKNGQTYFLEFCTRRHDVGVSWLQNVSRPICRVFRIDGERGFMVLYACSSELNSVATEVRTGVLKVVGLKLI